MNRCVMAKEEKKVVLTIQEEENTGKLTQTIAERMNDPSRRSEGIGEWIAAGIH